MSAPISVPEAMTAAVDAHRQGRFAEATELYRQVLAAAPDHADAHHLLGLTELQAGRPDAAAGAIARAVAAAPDIADYRLTLAGALHASNRIDQALAAVLPVLALAPARAEAHGLRGTLLAARGDRADAVASYGTALALNPDLAETHYNLANALQTLGRLDDAVASYQRALATLTAGAPYEADAWTNLGTALFAQGRLDEAIAAYRRLLQLKPGHGEAERTLLQWLNLQPEADAIVMRQARADWCRRHAAGFTVARHDNDRDPDRRLRIGYVAGPTLFASTHALTVLPMMQAHDRATVEVATYSDLASEREDAYTRHYKAASDLWRHTNGLDDAAFADLVRADRIDVLVDIVGHLGGPRFLALARRPAPVQIAAFVTGTSGLPAMDWALADPLLVPPAHEVHFTERVLRVPLAYLYKPLFEATPAAAPPCRAAGRITFGSLNGLAKVTEPVIALWARVLLAVPGSRLLVKGHAFSAAPARERYHAMFARHGIEAARIELRGWTRGFQEHLRVLDEIDVVLDSFPYSGVTTTCEALWMGVPVVTLAGARACGRYGLTLLSAVGLSEAIAATAEDFIGKAAALAADPDRLADWRRTLRPRMAASPLCDATAFARTMEAAYRTAWQAWCLI
jgi:predicted O-linked N-acetylglucosamine transferase (SPINDLY family)